MHTRTWMRPLAVAAALSVAAVAKADFTIAYTQAVENRPDTAHSPLTNETVTAYLSDGPTGTTREVWVQRNDSSGATVGSAISPFGVGTVDAQGRPAIAYGRTSNVYLVAVTENLSGFQRVIARLLDGQAQPIPGSTVFLFDDVTSTFVEGDGVGSLRIAYNSVLDQFLVTWQRNTGGSNGVWGQIVKSDGTTYPPVLISNHGVNGIHSHAVAYAPVANTNPVGGRYLFAVNGGGIALKLLDATGTPMLVTTDTSTGVPYLDEIPFGWGEPDGGDADPDIAYGKVQGKDRFLVVWSDEDNCRPSVSSCPDPGPDQWAGVWGSYLDPTTTLYYDDLPPANTPFPISKIAVHVAAKYEYRPRVAYNADALTFYVAWREYPTDDRDNDEVRSHIRGNRVDYFVEDGLAGTSLVPLPYDNVVVSDVTGTCPVPGALCRSDEDPTFPAVAEADGFNAVVAWEQQYPPDPSDHDVWGDFMAPPQPANDALASATDLVGTSVTLDGTLVGASNDGTADCGLSSAEPDVWYRYVAPTEGTLTVTTCGTHDRYGVDQSTDTVLSFHDASGVQLMGPGTCNDDYPFGDVPSACDGVDGGIQRDSALTRTLAGGETVLIRLSRYGFTYGGPTTLNLEFAAAGAGAVPDGAGVPGVPLTVSKSPMEGLDLSWGRSCAGDDVDFEVYEGSLGDFTSHQARLCSTGGATSVTIVPNGGNRYFLVVPRKSGREGSYGVTSSGAERPASTAACFPQELAACAP